MLSITLANSCVVDKVFGKNRIKMIVTDLTQKNLVRKIVIRHLNRSRVHIVENNEISPESK